MSKLMFPKPKKKEKKKFYRIPRVKKTSQAKIKRELDKLVSLIVRKRDGKCVCCGTTKDLTCGHLFSRRHNSTRWSLINCNCQCKGCNLKHNYDPFSYNNWFINKFGKEEWERLHQEHITIKKFNTVILEELLIELENIWCQLSN